MAGTDSFRFNIVKIQPISTLFFNFPGLVKWWVVGGEW